MTKQTIKLEVGQCKILDLDADDAGNFIAFTSDKSVLTNDHNLKVDLEVSFPIIRRLNDQTFLIADSRTKHSANGHIYSFNGRLLLSFNAGDGIQDIIIHRQKITITYFDEGVYGNEGPNNNGLSVFDLSGQLEYGINSSSESHIIDDCYCICKHGPNSVLFYAYSDFSVFELNLDTNKWEQFETPRDFLGASAITCTSDKIFLHSSYDNKRSFFSWDRNTNRVIKFGDNPSILKGMENGKFLTFDDIGYTIVDPLNS